MRFAILHPSRRPHQANKTVDKWFNRYDNNYWGDINYVLSLDTIDESLNEYMDHSRMDIIVNDNSCAVEAINVAAKHAMKYHPDIFIVVSDDTDCPDKWNRIIGDAVGGKRDFVMKTDDGIQKRIITMMIMDRVYYNRDGHIFDPAFSHSWSDTFATELAHKRGRVITRMDIKFPHNHYSVTGEQPDELYKRNDLTHDRDRHIYKAKMKTLN
jgi:hypothetical protein